MFRSELSRLLASPEFAGSRQLRDFLTYTSEQALAGRTHLEQTEIAAAVLDRREDFNPQDDATVRKLATLTRQKLEQHYSQEGQASPVRVTLPLRSYVPRYTIQETGDAPDAKPGRRGKRRWVAIFAAGIAVGVLVSLLRGVFPRSEPAGIVIETARGDVAGKTMDAPGGAVRLGPAVEEVDQVTVRLRFTPEHEAQQAGIVIWENENNFVRFCRKFVGRVHFEFGHEEGGVFRHVAENFVYDPEGQNGSPVWLTVRRDGRTFHAYASADGLRWRRVGAPVVHQEAMPKARLGVFAFNGRRQVPPATARFDRLSVGPVFFDMPDDVEPARWSLWGPNSECEAPANVFLQGHAFRFAPILADRPCEAGWTRPAPAGDWTLATRIDYLAEAGGSAGLVARGDQGSVRILRSDAVSFVHVGRIQIDEPDFGGRPPLSLRLWSRNGVLTGSYSRDEQNWKAFPVSVPVVELGANLRIGLRVARRQGAVGDTGGEARFYWLRREIDRLDPVR